MKGARAVVGIGAAALAVLLALVVGLVLMFGGAVGESSGSERDGPGGPIDPDTDIPDGAIPWLEKGGAVCDDVSPALLAAIAKTESNWELDAVSPVGAVGPFQFMPSTWAAQGRDADGNGTADPRTIPDAAVSAGHLICDNATLLRSNGVEVSVDTLAAAYNAGAGAVINAGGVPDIVETQQYVVKVKDALGDYSAGPTDPVDNPGAEAVIEAAQSMHGTPYSWGGGDFFGPTTGSNSKGDTPGGPWDGRNIVGFDCSGLMEYSFFTGTNGEVRMGDTTRDQITQGQAITTEELSPGDYVVFDDPETGQAFHVALYIGGDKFVHAEQPGTSVKTENLVNHSFWGRLTWHPRRILTEENSGTAPSTESE